jgi:hypothetical protein
MIGGAIPRPARPGQAAECAMEMTDNDRIPRAVVDDEPNIRELGGR